MLSDIKKVLLISVLFFVLLIIPILSLSSDMWDGVIIDYASKSKNFDGIEIFFFESRWILQYYLSKFIINLSFFFGIGYKNLNGIFIYIIFIFFLFENLYISKKIFNLKNNHQIWFLIFLATFPGFSVLASSIMTFHFLCFTSSLIGIRIIQTTDNNYKKIAGYILIILSFGFKPLLVFNPLLSLCYDFVKNKKYYFSSGTIIILILGIISFSFRLIFPPTGMYAGVYALIFFQENWIENFINGIYYYSSYPGLILILNLLSILSLFFLRYKLSINKDLIKNFFYVLVPVIILFFASSMPYIAVGKWSGFWDVKDWNIRQAILISIPFSLFAVILTTNILNFYQISLITKSKFSNCIFTIFLIINLTLFSSSIIEKMNRSVFENNLISSLQNYFDEPIKPGYVQLITKYKHPDYPNFRPVEANYLLYRAFNKRNYYSHFTHKRNDEFKINNYLLSDDRYQEKYIFDKNLKCTTYVYIETDNFNKFTDKLKNIARIQSPQVNIEKVEQSCN